MNDITHRHSQRIPGRHPAGFLVYAGVIGTGLLLLGLFAAGCGPRTVPAGGRPRSSVDARLYEVTSNDGQRVLDFDRGSLRLEGEVNAALARNGVDPGLAVSETRRRMNRAALGKGEYAAWVEADKAITTAPGQQGLTLTDLELELRQAARRAGAAVLSESREEGRLTLGLGTVLTAGGRRVTVVLLRLSVSLANPAPSRRVSGSGLDGGAASADYEGTPRAAIIIDDWGLPTEAASAMLNLPLNLNMAVIPFNSKSQDLARRGLERGWEVLVHLPMQPLGSRFDAGSGLIRVGMSNDEIADLTRRAFDDIPGADGANNHMGSRATADERVMRTVFAEVRARGWFFVDSRTTARSVVPQSAREAGIPYGINSVFLDGEDRHGFESTVEYVESQLDEMLRLARSNGRVIAIGHVRPATVEALRRKAEALERSGVQLVAVRELVALEYAPVKRGGRGYPGTPDPQPTKPSPQTPVSSAPPTPAPEVAPTPVAPVAPAGPDATSPGQDPAPEIGLAPDQPAATGETPVATPDSTVTK